MFLKDNHYFLVRGFGNMKKQTCPTSRKELFNGGKGNKHKCEFQDIKKKKTIGKIAQDAKKWEEHYKLVIDGIKNNIPLHLRVLEDETFQAGDFSTRFLDTRAKP